LQSVKKLTEASFPALRLKRRDRQIWGGRFYKSSNNFRFREVNVDFGYEKCKRGEGRHSKETERTWGMGGKKQETARQPRSCRSSPKKNQFLRVENHLIVRGVVYRRNKTVESNAKAPEALND